MHNNNYRQPTNCICIDLIEINLYISKEINESSTDNIDTVDNNDNNDSHNHSSFRITGGTSDMKVSWQVTGIRKDPWAKAHRVEVEEDKPAKERHVHISRTLWSTGRQGNTIR